MTCSVYLISAGCYGPVKVGISSNIKRRLRELDADAFRFFGHFVRLKVADAIEYRDRFTAAVLEKDLHKEFIDEGIERIANSEWFIASEERASELFGMFHGWPDFHFNTLGLHPRDTPRFGGDGEIFDQLRKERRRMIQ